MTGPTLEQLRRTNLEISEAIAPGWERRREFVEEVAAPVRAWLVRELAPQRGEVVLELAAGAGDTGYELAETLGPEGRLISTDLSPAMVAVAKRRAEALGLPAVEHRVLDAERMDLPDDSADHVLCRFGYMLMPDPAAALAETRRVLRPGGRLALAVWGPPERNPFFGLLMMTLVEAGHMEPPQPGGPGPMSMGAEERTRGLLSGAGFTEIRTEDVQVQFRVRDAREYVEIATDTAGPIAMALQALEPGVREDVAGMLQGRIDPFAANGGYALPGVALCALAG